MIKQKIKAFTLVELIVGVTIIWIISIMWFLSLSEYIEWSKDSSRIAAINNLESSLSTYAIKKWYYPVPDNSIDVTYSWSLIWEQWTIWNKIISLIDLNNKVVDPSTWNEYTYSITNNKKEFQISWVLKTESASAYYLNNTYANDAIKAVVRWNYNWMMLSIKQWSSIKMLAVPSIISTDLSIWDLQNIADNNQFVYDGYQNLPESFKESEYNLDWWIDFSANNLLIYSWSRRKKELFF